MTDKHSLAVFGDIDDRYVLEAQTAKRRSWSHWLTVAACLAVVAMTLGFLAERLVMPSITATAKPHLCEIVPDPGDKDFGTTLRIVQRLRYEGQWYTLYRPSAWYSVIGYESLGKVYREAGCPFCEGAVDGRPDIGGELYEVAGIDPSIMVALRDTQGKMQLFFVQDCPVFENGKALFEELFSVGSRTCAVRSQTFQEALDGQYPTRSLSMQEALTGQLLEALCKAEPTDSLQSKVLPSYVMTLYLDNGVCVELRLIRGGYVKWRDQTFAIDKEISEAVFSRLEASV